MAAQTIELLRYLLPGFLTAWVFFGLSLHPKPSQFERIVQAMIFTLLIQAGTSGVQQLSTLIGHHCGVIGYWTENVRFGWSVLMAILLGVIFAVLADRDYLHYFLRIVRVTQQTSRPNEWTSAFSWDGSYVVLHLPGERRLFGYPSVWPSDPECGHIVLKNAIWLLSEDETQDLKVNSILIPAKDVEMVEFLDHPEEPE